MNSAPSLARLCLDQVHLEEAYLAEAKGTLVRMRASLLTSAPAGLAEVLQQEEACGRRGQAMGQQRRRFRRAVADRLGWRPEEVTLKKLVELVPADDRVLLMQARERIHTQVRELQQLTQANGVLILYFLDFVQRFFLELTGAGNNGERYSARGARQPAACGSLLQLQG